MKTKAVIFDLYETLITEFLDGQRITPRTHNYMELLGVSNEDYKQEWELRLQKRMAGVYLNYHSVIRDMVESRGIEFNKEAVEYLYQSRINEKMIPFQNIRPDVLELLDKLHKSSIKIGLISNCTEEEVRAWRNSELASYFNQPVFSYQVGLAKPDERIYQLACERLSVSPEEAIFIGDGGSNELEGATKAGLRAFQAVWFKQVDLGKYKQIESPLALINEIEG